MLIAFCEIKIKQIVFFLLKKKCTCGYHSAVGIEWVTLINVYIKTLSESQNLTNNFVVKHL